MTRAGKRLIRAANEAAGAAKAHRERVAALRRAKEALEHSAGFPRGQSVAFDTEAFHATLALVRRELDER